MRINQESVVAFAQWSGDRNPIHVDAAAAKKSAFGGTIVHGALSTIEALAEAKRSMPDLATIQSLEIIFRGEVRPERDYRVAVSRGADSINVQVSDAAHTQLSIAIATARAEASPHPHGIADSVSQATQPAASEPAAWVPAALLSEEPHGYSGGNSSGLAVLPANWQPADFRQGEQQLGVHRFASPLAALESTSLKSASLESASPEAALTSAQAQVLALCSYIVGMKAPGLASLFTRLKVDFAAGAEAATDALAYRLTFALYDPHFRLLETELEVASLEGQPIAKAIIQSYVRFPSALPDMQAYASGLTTQVPALQRKVALVCGASRGLGAELAAALGAAQCRVYLVCRHPDDQTQLLADAIRKAGGTATIETGDVGDAQWCRNASARIQQTHGRLDVLILNACAPPTLTHLSAASADQSSSYIAENIALTQTPLVNFLPLVAAGGGTVVAISSSAVVETPVGFGDYIAVKMAMEGAIMTAARENPGIQFLIARPPKLRTSWSDSPLRAMGAIPPQCVALRVVQAIAQPDPQTNLRIMTSFPFDEPDTQAPPPAPDLTLVLCASFTLDPIRDCLQLWSKELDVSIEVELAPYAQVLQQLLNPASELARNPGGSVVLVRLSDWLRELPERRRRDAAEVECWLRSTAAEHVQALKTHREFAQGSTLLLICPSTIDEVLTASMVQDIQRSVASALADTPGLTVLEARSYHATYEVPEESIYDPLREEIAHIPYQSGYYSFLATLIARVFHRRLSAPKKVVVLDCDNTLWSGVVGEVGAEGIEFTDAHRQLHRTLVRLADSGILLCLCSKNEPDDVSAVFASRTDFALRPEQFVASIINWQPKSENIRALADRLKLGLGSFIFLDDSPVECAEVRSHCPSVLTVQWPQDPRAATRLLDHLWEFDTYATTAEDRSRTQMYREEFQRQEIHQQSASFQEFIDSLRLQVQFQRLSEDDVQRAAQLTMRTNQFNFTTIRRTEAELRALMADSRYECRTVRVSDRFGDYGLVGLFIAQADGNTLAVDTFLLSCRVLGRGVEHQMAAELGRIAQARNSSHVRWHLTPTERNRPAQIFLNQIAAAALPTDDLDTTAHNPNECLAETSALVALRFDATQASPSRGTEEGDAESMQPQPPRPQTTQSIESIRQRERQIERSAQRLSSYAQLSQSNAKNGDLPSPQQTGDIAVTVRELFAQTLRLPITEITRIDRLDAMGCDSLQIVELTVALTKRFPWLPKTLLFEHRRVSEIVAQITRLSSGETPVAARKANAAAAGTRSSASRDIAIVGIGVNCAGGKSPQELWEFLAEGRSAISRVPAEHDSFVGQLRDARPHFAGLLPGVADFDPEFFGISPREAEFMDPQLRLLLQTAWHALEDAGGQGKGFDPATGIFVGVMYETYGRFANVIASQKASAYRCWEGFSLPNRLSQVLGCYGPSLSVDTACSSSATALHYACHSLREGDCTTAIVSGVNLIIDPERLVQFGRLGILSLSGHCVPFGAGADGTVLGEGVISLVLRPVEEARRRSDRIYAVIKGTGLSLGAGSVGFTAPNPNAQAQAARNAIVAADIDPRTVSYIETHGTGTELGDPIEVRGLELAYCDRSLWRSDLQVDPACTIGSIKPNIGHLEAGAGLSGVMKAALQLYHRRLLPSLTSPSPNPQIHFESLPFDVQRSFEAWRPLTALGDGNGDQVTLPRRAGVNSFGVGGSNVHVILEEASEPMVAGTPERERSAHVLTLSATTEQALQLQAAAWQRYLTDCDPDAIANACYSANVGRKHHCVRTAVVIPPLADACDSLERTRQGQAEQDMLASAEHPRLDAAPALKSAFLFTGQGAQYPGMLRQLHHESPVFRDAFDQCARYLDRLLPQTLEAILFTGVADDREHAIHQTGYTQPALFTIQYALFQLWKSWGIVGDVLMGHSIGEVAAYCVAGGCSLEDALELVAARGRLMQALPTGGAMCSIALDQDTIRRAIEDLTAGVSIAAVNGPKQTVISGPRAAVALVAERLEAQHGIKTTQLSVSHAFHSALMEPMLDEFEKVLSKLDLGTPQMPIVSSATGAPIAQAMGSPAYWLQQARHAVLFTDAMESLQRQGVTHYIELGPHPVMLSMGRQCIADPRVHWLPSIRRGQDDWSVILDSLCKLFSAGAEVDWRGFDAPYARRRISVPGYQFDTRRIWLEELHSGPSMPTLTTAGAAPGTAAADREGARGYLIEWIESPRAVRRRTDAALGQSVRQEQQQQQRPEAIEAARSGAAADGNDQPSRWLVLSAHASAANALAESLAARGIACLPAALALAPADPQAVNSDRMSPALQIGKGKPSADGKAEVHLASLAELEELLSGNTFARIIYLDLPRRAADQPAAEQTAQALYDRAVAGVFDLAQVVSAAVRSHAATSRCLWTITSNAVAADWDGALNIGSAPLWGFARVAALECEAMWGGIIDVDDPTAEVDRLIEEIIAPDDDDQIVLRQSRRLVPRLKRRSAPTDQRGAGLGAAFDLTCGAILITGGVGGIGMHIAQWLAEQGAKHLLLTSRTGVATGDASATIEALKRRGVDVSVVAADVSTPQGIAACFRELGHTPLIGVIHAAGIDLRVPITSTSREQVEQVLAAKVKGAWLLHQACEGLELQMFVCLSSMASILGSSDRSVYAAANTFLDALAYHRHQSGLPALTLNFGPWTGGGMADAQSLAQLERIGNRGLVPEDTLRLLTQLLREQDTQVMVADIDWQRFRAVLETRRVKPILGELGREAKTPSGETARPSSASRSTWIEALRVLPDGQRANQLLRLLQDEFAQTLRLPNARGVSPDRSLFQMGLDSITAVEFSIKLQRHTGLQTSSMLVGAPTLRKLTDTLLPLLAGALAGPARTESAAGQDHSDQQSIDGESAGATSARNGSVERQSAGIEDASAGQRDALGLSSQQLNLATGLGVPAVTEVFGVDAAMEPAIVAFCREAWPDRRPDLLAARWNWMFLQSAKRVGVAPRVWLFRDQERILGHMGAQFFRLKIGQQERTTGWLVDTMVLESHRDQGIGARLLLQSQEDMPFALSLGQTAQARTILKAMGWKYVAPLQTYVLALNANRVLQDKLPSPVVPAVSTLLRLRGSTRRLLSVHSTGSATIHQIDRFSARHDALWRDISSGYGCAAVRDASYLNWKYVDQPGQEYVRLEVRREDEVIGCVVLLLTEPNDVYQHRRAYIVDLITAADTSHLHTALRAAIRHCEELEIDAVVMHVINRPIERALKNFGFLRRTPTRHLMIADSESDQPQLLDPAQWLITHGDSDIDRP